MPESETIFPSILLVDDDAALTDLSMQWLAGEGYVCRVCDSGEGALDLLEREDFGIVGFDCRMGGLGLVRTIRARKGPRIPYIIAATENPSQELIASAFQAGVDDFVSKPAERNEMWTRLRAARRVISLEQELIEGAGQAVVVGMHRGGIRELSEVVAALAHDLRTPLGTLRMAASTLRNRSESQAPELLPTVDRIERVSIQMAETLDDVVSAFLADDGTSDSWTEFDMTAEVVHAVEMLSAAVPPGTILCLPEGAFPVCGNPFGLRRLVLNLVSNALRHSEATRIRMELARGADPTWMRLDVSDDGKGISDPLLRHLGETLLLSSATHRQEFFVKGNGLGFTICRRIAAQHGGRILVSSGPRGTRVRVWLRTHESGPRRKVDLAPLETEFLP
jgi:signal transduction histidine kinase